jgi:DNA end-binding protein Ku
VAPRSIWNGTLAFGEVLIPVKIFSVVQQHRIQFREVRLNDGSKISHKRFGSDSGEEVPNERIRKAYETSPGHQVLLSDEEIAAATGPNPKTIQVEQFVPTAQIDPIYYEKPYVLGAQNGGERAYRVLHDALERSHRTGIGRFVLRSREQLVALAPRGPALGLYTMRFADELVRSSELDVPSLSATPSAKELEMAQRLIDTLAEPWEPEAFEDRYREAVMAVIKRKASGAEVAVAAAPEPKPTADLLGVLAQSIERSGKGKAAKRRPPRRTTPVKPAPAKKAGTR